MRLFVFDDLFFGIANTGIAKFWRKIFESGEFFEILSDNSIVPYLLNRTDHLTDVFDYGEDISQRGDTLSDITGDTLMLGALGSRLANDHEVTFCSSYYSIMPRQANLVALYDFIPEREFPNAYAPHWLNRRLPLSVGSFFFAISDATVRDARELYPRLRDVRIPVVYPAVDQSVFHPCHGACQCTVPRGIESFATWRHLRYIVCTTGRADYKNFSIGVQALLESIETLDAVVFTGVEVDLDVAGRFAAKGVQVFFLDCDEVTYAYLIRHAESLLYPSRREGFGLPVLEGIRSGCRVVIGWGSSLDEFNSPLISRAEEYSASSFAAAIPARAVCGLDAEPMPPFSTFVPNSRIWSDTSVELGKVVVDAFSKTGIAADWDAFDSVLERLAVIPTDGW